MNSPQCRNRKARVRAQKNRDRREAHTVHEIIYEIT